MHKAKSLIVACLAMTFAVSACASTAVGATAGWMVNGITITKAVAVLPEAKVLERGLLAIPNSGVSIKCEGGWTINGGNLVPTNLIEATSIEFEACTTGGSGGCTVPNTLKTTPISGVAALEAPLNTIILVSPKTKTTFITIQFSGEICALLGVQPVTGRVHFLIHEGFDERLSHTVLAFSLPGGLKAGSEEVSLHKFGVDIRLTSDLPWSFL